MSVSFRLPGLPGTPTPPGELTELSQAADEMRNRVRCSAGCDIDIFAKAVFQYFGFMLFQAQTAGGATYILVDGQMGLMVIWSSSDHLTSVPGVSFAEWSDFTDVMCRAQGVQRFGDNGRRRHRRRERLRHHGIVATADVASLPSLHQND